MRLLIIGAGGYLGSHVRRQASAAGLTVVTASRSPLPGSPAHERLDLSADDPDTIGALVGSTAPDAVINCAGATTGGPGALADANITGTRTLVTAMLRARVRARLVHLGSAAEYGPSEPGVPVTESAPARPAGAYGLTKLAGTLLVEMARTAGLDAVVLRVFNPVGRGAPENSLPGSLAAQLRRAQADGADVRLGPLDAVRDFVDARDVADAVLAAASAPALPHPVLNVGSGTGVPARALVKELLAISGCGTAVHEDATGSARSADRAWQQADISRAGRDLDWRPRRDLAASLSDLWAAGDG
jgi:nucleoside-diphosphate-sugar epimerase